MKDQLYEQDYALWLDRTVEALKNRELEAIDWQNLIEEVESLGRSEKRSLRSYLRQLFVYLLKRRYTNLSQNYRGWEREIANFRLEVKDLLRDSPTLKRYFATIFYDCYQDALSLLRSDPDYNLVKFPEDYPFPQDPDRLLNDIFWE